MAANQATFRYGGQTWDNGAWTFDFDPNNLYGPLTDFLLNLSYGTNTVGVRAYSNHLVVKSDCRTVITSYGQ